MGSGSPSKTAACAQFAVALAAAALLAAGAPGASGSSAPPNVVNFGLATGAFLLNGDLLTLHVHEREQNGDLNGDGDIGETVLFVHDAATSTTANTRLAVLSSNGSGGLVGAAVPEGSHRQTPDLNGDGDANDVVLHVFRTATGSATNLGLAVNPAGVRTDGEHVVFSVSEALQAATDLNGDGDTMDEVVHLWSATSGLSNLRLAAFGGFRFQNGRLMLRVLESGQGGSDLNGDGDAGDSVLHLFELADGSLRNVGRAAGGCFPAVLGDVVAFCVPEAGDGRGDLNGDGDVADPVLHIYDAAAQTTRNVGLWAEAAHLHGTRIMFNVSESGQGADLNGDGDTSDPILHLLGNASAVPANLRLPATFPGLDGDLVAFITGEAAHGNTDLNGDGDATDSVLHVHDFGTGATSNTELASNTVPSVGGDGVAFLVQEGAQGNVDLNGDGDSLDAVLHDYDGTTGAVENLARAGLNPRVEGRRVYFSAVEASQGSTDLNGDGDAIDLVLHSHERTSGTTLNLQLADRGIASVSPGRIAFDVREDAQAATDMNGDGDAADLVLHLYSPGFLAAPPDTMVSGRWPGEPAPSGTWVRPTAMFTFSSTPFGASFECRMNGGAWFSCGSQALASTIRPEHLTFDFRAVNAVGPDPTPVSLTLRVVRPFVVDWDGNGKADVSVWRPQAGGWYVQGQPTSWFGLNGDVPVPGQWDADPAVDRAIWRPAVGGWYVEGSATVYHGARDDVPVPADWDGDGDLEPIVWRPEHGGWYVRGVGTFYFGASGDVPVLGDYDADPQLDLAVYRSGAWYIDGSAIVFHGLPNDVPVPADWDGDGKTDIAVYRPDDGGWHVRGMPVAWFGLPGDVPVVGDFDADPAVDRAVWRPTSGGWYVEGSAPVFFGLPTDIP